jgi:hypothetical protein
VDAGFEEGYGACLLFVEHDLDEGDTRCIIDANMDEFPANATTVALTGTIAGDAMADPIDLAEFLDVDMAMTRRPEVFEGVRCMVSPQPLSSGVALERALERFGIPLVYMDDLNERIRLQTSFTLDQFSPVPWAKGVTIPTFLYQVRDDFYTRPDDIQAMYDNIPIADKKLYWIEGTKRRWDGYTYFQREPRQMLE